MSQQRPVNLDLATLKFPIMAISSILHRISGIFLFLLSPLMIYFFDMSLKNAGTFTELQSWLESCVYCKLAVWAFGVAIIYHLFAGMRHMVMDIGYGETVSAARKTAIAVIALSLVFTVLLGIWIW